MTIVGQSTIPTDPALQVLPAPPSGQVYQTQGANYVVYTPSPSTGPHHHSGPLATASLPHPQQWYEKPGGVVTPDQSYYTTQGSKLMKYRCLQLLLTLSMCGACIKYKVM